MNYRFTEEQNNNSFLRPSRASVDLSSLGANHKVCIRCYKGRIGAVLEKLGFAIKNEYEGNVTYLNKNSLAKQLAGSIENPILPIATIKIIIKSMIDTYTLSNALDIKKFQNALYALSELQSTEAIRIKNLSDEPLFLNGTEKETTAEISTRNIIKTASPTDSKKLIYSRAERPNAPSLSDIYSLDDFSNYDDYSYIPNEEFRPLLKGLEDFSMAQALFHAVEKLPSEEKKHIIEKAALQISPEMDIPSRIKILQNIQLKKD